MKQIETHRNFEVCQDSSLHRNNVSYRSCILGYIVRTHSKVHSFIHTLLRDAGAWLWWRSFRWRGIDHQLEALFSSWELRNVVFGMSSSDMLLHRSVALLLFDLFMSANCCQDSIAQFELVENSLLQG